ncbi:MAG TPA: DUF4870 domain-containing protein [Candidatus Sulfotelmatobacter sp.]|jgi:uncharacterized membrane protein|nr:DUF4870 domain-containing protein [Candidatus Sulfotelmatobacter sp.]
MAFCKSCGQDIGTANFCSKCGASQIPTASPGGGAGAVAVASSAEGLAENVAGLLCYALGWVTGLIFLLIDKRPWVKFHAAQSIAVFGGLTIIRIGLLFMTHFMGWGIQALLGLIGFILWIFLMVKAYQHETVRIPIAADIADNLAGK